MKLLTRLKEKLSIANFDLEHEANMVQSRILSSILELVEKKGYTQSDLEKSTGIKQSFISALFNNRKKLNMEHIALFQNALDVVLQPPVYLSEEEHKNEFYVKDNYNFPTESYIIGIDEYKVSRATVLTGGHILSAARGVVHYNQGYVSRRTTRPQKIQDKGNLDTVELL